jgi:hypothetical protein
VPDPRAFRETADRIARVSGLENVVGRPSTVWTHQKLQRELPRVADAVEALRARIGDDAPEPQDEPLFIFSAGWRSGSTLLQRLIVSSGAYFIWGEPYHQTDVVRRLAESLLPFGTGWPPAEYVHDPTIDEDTLSAQWIANFYPPLSRLLDAHRAFMRKLLAPPPGTTTPGWGLKEVRLSAQYAVYLRLLFPKARVIFLVRDPRAAYRSYRDRPTWFERWPRSQVRTPSAYGQVWRRLAGSFLEYEHPLGATLIRYEDLVGDGGETLARLGQAVGVPLDGSVLDERVGGGWAREPGGPSPLELRMLDRATAPVAARLGYGSSARS